MAVDGKTVLILTACAREKAGAGESACWRNRRLGALLCFDMNNVAKPDGHHIGTWAQDKISRFRCYHRMTKPILWDSDRRRDIISKIVPGSENDRGRNSAAAAGHVAGDGARRNVARKIKVELRSADSQEPLGSTWVEPPILFALQKEGIKIVDGQQLMSDARVIKTQDEISLLNHSAR